MKLVILSFIMKGEEKMNKMMDFMQQKLEPIAAKMSANRGITAISNAMMALLPAILVGSIFTIITMLPISELSNFLQTSGLGKIFTVATNCTVGLMALATVFSVTYYYIQEEIKSPVIPALLALSCFLIVTPLDASGSIPFENLGARGMFSALVVGLTFGWLYCFIIRKKLYIHLPDSVPPFVKSSFESLVPSVVLIILFGLIAWLFSLTEFLSIHGFVYTMLQRPLSMIGNNIFSLCLIVMIQQIIWCLGVHGGNVGNAFTNPVLLTFDAANLAAFGENAALPYIIGKAFQVVYSTEGGQGATLGLNIDMLLFSKSERYKSLGRATIGTSIFCVNEPIIFGFPIVLNPIMMIPFVFTPVILLLLAYGLTSIDILPRLIGAGFSYAFPRWLIGAYQGGILVVLFCFFGIFLSALIYYPFFKIQDNIAYKEEQQLKRMNEGDNNESLQ